MSESPLFESVAELLPHDEPMILIDGVSAWGNDFLEATVDLKKPCLFTDQNGNVPAWVGIEYMSQTIAAFAGLKAKLRGAPIRIGFLLGTTRYHSKVGVFQRGASLTIKVVDVFCDDDNFGLFDCQILSQGSILVDAEIKAIQPDNIEEILKRGKPP